MGEMNIIQNMPYMDQTKDINIYNNFIELI